VSQAPTPDPLPADFLAREHLKQRPDFTFKHGAARLRWDTPQHVLVEFDYLRADNRSGELRGQITVTSNAPGSDGLLHRANLNLTSTQARTACVKQLASRDKDQGIDWNALVEQACYLTVEAHRAGEPAILLRNAERPADAGWLLPPIVLGRLPTILFGDGGTAKSYLSLAAAISIHSGYELLSIKPSARVNVAYLDWEFDAYEHRDRMRRLVGEDMPGIVYVPCVGPLRDQVDRLQRVIREHDIGFVVIDSVGMACEGPPEEAQSALGFFDALRSLQVGALCVAHVNRSGDTDRPFGSTFWHNSARSTWYAKKQQEAAASTLTVGLFNRKSNIGPLSAPLGFTLAFDDNQTTIERTDVRDVPELAGQVPLKARMIRALGSGALTYVELSTDLGADGPALRQVVHRYPDLFVRIPGLDGIARIGLAAPSDMA
jgi:AAA domain